jgi:soluble lytic murein transglycosylase-like protein
MAEHARASLLVRLMLIIGVMLYGCICGTSPLVTSLVRQAWNTLTAPPRPPVTVPAVVPTTLSPAFRAEVLRWEPDILVWSQTYQLDPNLTATIMQVESCGDPQALSPAGAAGLFQVMPFHFAPGEDRFDPSINAARGLGFFADGLARAGGDAGLALAAYNGGQGLIDKPVFDWPNETRDYYEWATGIYTEASAGQNPSATLERWLAAGGLALCQRAAAYAGSSP